MLIDALIYLLVAGLILGLIYYAFTEIPILLPFAPVVRVVVVVIFVICMIVVLVPFAGGHSRWFPR